MSGETAASESGWTVDTLMRFVQVQLDDMRSMLQERYETQTRALDSAFLAQSTAMQTALTAAEKAVAAALAAAEKAVNKAEDAAAKRFEAVNEFRGQLSDQAATFLPRTEADVRIEALSTKVDDLGSRLDVATGRTTGLDKGWAFLVGAIVAVGGIVGLVVSVMQ